MYLLFKFSNLQGLIGKQKYYDAKIFTKELPPIKLVHTQKFFPGLY